MAYAQVQLFRKEYHHTSCPSKFTVTLMLCGPVTLRSAGDIGPSPLALFIARLEQPDSSNHLRRSFDACSSTASSSARATN